MMPRPQISTPTDTLFPDTTRFRSDAAQGKIAVHIHDRCKEGNDMQPRNCTTIGRSVCQDQSALRRSLLIGTALALLWSGPALARNARSEEHTSELQSLMRITYAVFCLNTKQKSVTKPYIITS